MSELLVIASVEHTASVFCRELLAKHPAISTDMAVHQYYMSDERSKIYRHGNNSLSCPMSRDFYKDLCSLAKPGERYVQWNEYVHSCYFLPILLCRPFNYKLVVTLRHPVRVMRSSYRRGEGWKSIFAHYAVLLHVIKQHHPDVFVFQADRLEGLSAPERHDVMKRLFEDFLGLNVVEAVRFATQSWHRVNPTHNEKAGYVPLLHEHIAEINARIETSGIFDVLKDVPLPFRYTRGEVSLA